MTRRRTRRRGQAGPVAAVALTAVAVAAAVIVLHVIGWVAITAAVGAGCWYAGRRSLPVARARATRPAASGRAPANARSLAQLNRHLNERLDATQAKLEAAMDRADRAQEAARAARDEAERLAGRQ